MKKGTKILELIAPLHYDGGSGNVNICAIYKQYSFFKHVSAFNPPQRKANERWR
jgi:hypothetical protein